MEDREGDLKLRRAFLVRLGMNPHATDLTAPLRNWPKEDLFKAVTELSLDDKAEDDLQKWILRNPDGTLQTLMDQLTTDHLDDKETDVPARPAQIQPQGEVPMHGGGMPPGGGAAGA